MDVCVYNVCIMKCAHVALAGLTICVRLAYLRVSQLTAHGGLSTCTHVRCQFLNLLIKSIWSILCC